MECTKDGCKKPMTEKVKKYSEEKFGKAYCFDCQKTAETKPEAGTPDSNETFDEQKLIVRQSMMKCAVQLICADKFQAKDLYVLAEKLVGYVYHGPSGGD